VPENSKIKSPRKTGRIKRKRTKKHGIFQRGGGERESEREEKWGRERTLEVGDGSGVGREGDDEARAEGRLQEYRRGVGGGHGVFSCCERLGSLTSPVVWSAAEERRKAAASRVKVQCVG
jgi:hypothetical protein